MTPPPLDIVFVGLSLSSSWGNGHATTYRSLLAGLSGNGHRLTFLERDVPWYASHRDLGDPGYCELRYYRSVAELKGRHAAALRRADVVIIGSYVPEGVAVIETVRSLRSGALCFYDIDTPVTLAKLEAGDAEYIARHQVPDFDIYFSFTGGPTLKRLKDRYRARRAEPLYCSVDPEMHRAGAPPRPKRWDLGYLGTYSRDRQEMLERLLIEVARRMPERRFVVAGPQYPADIAWPANVERIQHLAPSDHASFYASQRFTLNITRGDMMLAGWSPSVRLFEAAACGVPIITDRWPGLDEFFPAGEAICCASCASEVVDILGSDDQLRLMTAAEARARVLSAHTSTARARQLEQHLRSLGAGHVANESPSLVDQAI
jgi:spore maturation protein CgeB